MSNEGLLHIMSAISSLLYLQLRYFSFIIHKERVHFTLWLSYMKNAGAVI